ncbi:MAG TPA: Hsp70 family protein [Kofleriaceae bacterium]|nr:Hsp70 family protein [Kofleriaceae bacterium]
MNDPIVGIDLGTSNAVVGYADDAGTVRVLADESGYKIHPSVVSFHPSGGVVVGAAAKQRKVIDPKNTIFSVKRLIGRDWDAPEVHIAKSRMPYTIKEGQNHLPVVATRGGEFAVPEISAIVLDHMRNIASGQLKTEVARAVVTVPASFNDAQRSATATAGAIAGLTIVRVLNEPTAAALAYGAQRNLRQIIAVYDFGGGTFDITVLRLADQVYEVLGTSGDTFLGGDDLDERLVDRMVEKFLAENRVDLRTNEVAMMRLRAVAEQTKIELSRRTRAVVRIDEIAYGTAGKPLDLQIEVRRDDFVSQVADIIDRTFPVCQEALQLAQIHTDQIDDIILVGGTTKIPYVRDQVSKFFAKAPRTDVNPEEAVAIGAALQASALDRVLKRKPPTSRRQAVVMPPPADQEPTFQDAPTATRPDLARPDSAASEDSLTEPAGELPVPDLEPREKRATAGYTMRGQHHDRFDEHTPMPVPTPPPQAKPLGRMTRQGVSPPAAPRTTSKEMRVPPVPPQAPTPQQTIPLPRGMVPPAPSAVPEPLPSARAVPIAAPQAPTLMIDPPAAPPRPTQPPVSPASTARGMVPPESSAAITANRFPPQTYPVLAAMPPPTVLDVTPRGLGIGTVAGYCEELIRRNSRVPTEIRKLFTTSRDLQQVVRIVVVQGESRRLDHNVVIGDLRLDDLPPRPRGETAIEVTFMLDASGILQVRARDANTGREQRASLDVVGSIPEAEVASSRDRLNALRR